VIGDDSDAVKFCDPLGEVVCAEFFVEPFQRGDVGVGILDLRPFSSQHPNDVECGGFAGVAYIFLIGDAEYEDGAAAYAFAFVVEGIGDSVYDEFGHAGVDGGGEVDEPCGVVKRPKFPGEVLGVYRDAMAAESWARIEGDEAEGFCFCGFDDFPNIETEVVAHDGEFVYQPDVDGAVSVFEEFCHLGGAGA